MTSKQQQEEYPTEEPHAPYGESGAQQHEPIDDDDAPPADGGEQQQQQGEGGAATATVGRGFDIQGSVADFNATGSLSSGNYSLPVSWHKLSYSAGSLHILKNLTGSALPGRCLGIMGSSGAGKTTFLNAICDRLATSSTLRLSGRRQLGDVEFQRDYRRAMGFVTQDDIISALATPFDALWFSVRTRRGTDRAETLSRVNETLEVLRLAHCKDTKVGIAGLEAGLSGGERKRCNIGIELICDPKVLLLDEPTSGLDSVTSAKVIHLARQIARTGRTVIYTIHQPTSEVISYFDDLMLMTQGRCVYHGTMADAIPYFNSIGFVCPDTYTPTDYFMSLLQDYITSKVLIKRWKKYLKNGTRTAHTVAVRLAQSHSESSAGAYLVKYLANYGSNPAIQMLELVKRNLLEMSRDYLYLFSYASQALFFSVVVGLIFLNMRMNTTGMQDRQGMLFMTVMNRCMGACFIMISVFDNNRAVYSREQGAAAYTPFMFFLARTVAEFPLQVFCALVECCVLYWMVGLHASPGAFFYYFGVLATVSQVGTAFGFLLGAVCPSLVLASAITPLLLMPLSMAGGLFASTDRLRPYWYWIEKPSFMRQAFILVIRNEMHHIKTIACNNYDKGDAYCVTQPKAGVDVLNTLGFDSDPQSDNLWMWLQLLFLYVFFNTGTVIALEAAARRKA